MALLRAVLLLSAVGAGCAAAPIGPPPPPPEASFRDVRSVAILRRSDPDAPGEGEGRRRDPLDALQGAVASRGLKIVTLELPPRPPPQLEPVEQALLLAEGAAQAAAPEAGRQVGSIGARAAAALDRLGAEAFAIYVRGPAWHEPPRPFGQPYGLAPPPAQGSALALVARDGTVVTFAWGGRAPYGAGPVNAAEAIDLALTLLLPPPE